MYEQPLREAIREAISLIETNVSDLMPYIAQPISTWMRRLSGSFQPSDYFEHPAAFPMFLLPWWVEKTITSNPGLEFQKNIAYATANGYYYIRLIDNIMDGDREEDSFLLPVLNFFHTEFQSSYFQYFPANNRFWTDFIEHWFHSADCAMQDAMLTELNEEQFRQFAAQKVCAVKIPVAAVCYYHDRDDLIKIWYRFIDLLGCWHQMMNDLFDWNKDMMHHTTTYFLSEAYRRKDDHETVFDWVMREGFVWGCQVVIKWTAELKQKAKNLQSQDMFDYFKTREAMFLEQKRDVLKGFESMIQLISILREK